jgi:hypothetical protein
VCAYLRHQLLVRAFRVVRVQNDDLGDVAFGVVPEIEGDIERGMKDLAQMLR